MNFAELEAKAAEQSEARAEAFKKHLTDERERELKEVDKIQNMLANAGKRMEAEKRAHMKSQMAAEEEKAKAEIRTKYANEHGISECDKQAEPLKKMLRDMMGGNK